MAIVGLKLNNGETFELEVNSGDYVIDCGANIGEVTTFFYSHGAYVLAKSSGIKKMFLHEHAERDQVTYSTGSSIIEDKENVNKNNYIEVELVNLCEFLKLFNKKVKVLKIDIEGAEVELLNDLMDDDLIRDIPYVFVETHEKKIPSLRKSTATLKKRIEEENYSNINLNWI